MPLPESLLRSTWSDLDLRLTAGTWPEGMHGEMFISAPVVDPRLSFQLFGFGAMVRISLEPGRFGAPSDRFALRARTIDTPIRRIHELASDEFTGGLLGLESPFGHANMVNTAPLPWNGRMFATWDVGRPVEIDPTTLGFLGEVGSARSWGGDSFGRSHLLFPQIFSTAHPIVDPDRNCLWTVKLDLMNAGLEPSIVRYDGDGPEVSTWRLPGAAVVGSMHTITQTANWLVLADSGNFKADPGEIMGGARTVQIDTDVPVFLVRKDVLDDTPPGAAVPYERATVAPTTGHYYADWDDTEGIRILFEHMDLTDLGHRLLPDDVDADGRPINPAHLGMYQMAMAEQTISEMLISPGSDRARPLATTREEWMWNLQLSAMDWSPEGRRTPTHHHVVFQGRRPGALARRILDLYRDRIDHDSVIAGDQRANLATFRRGGLDLHARWEFPSEDDFPSSPIFVPRRHGVPGGGDGWVVVPVLNDDGARIDVFDAAAVDRGPVASLAGDHGERLPFMLHAVWAPATDHPVDRERLRVADDVDPDAVASLRPDLRTIVESVLVELS